MAAGNRNDDARQPQFTNTQYEIPSWQTPWNKPWYQRTDGANDELPNRYKYNARGHLDDCTCSNCEDDLETAFSPQTNTSRQSVSDIPNDRHEEIKIQVHLEDLDIKNSGDDVNAASGTNIAPKKVFLFSDLAEVIPSTSSSSLATTRSSSTSTDRSSSLDSTAHGNMTHDSIMESFGNLTAIQAISEQAKDIQSRVYNYRGKSDTLEYQTMKDLLLSLMRELNRIHSTVEWFAVSKKMALEAMAKTLQTLEDRAKQSQGT